MILTDFMDSAHARLETLFNQYLTKSPSPAKTLQEALAYSTLNGGKRIRPLLVYLTGKTFDAAWENLDVPACAIEFIHVYSLIHDDLPAMDNSDLRRGKASCHKKFNEAIAILAGDALQPLAFEIIAEHPAALSPAQRLRMIKILSEMSGLKGMAAGQMLDMEGTHTLDALTKMYGLKTGALLKASVQLGAIAANISDENILDSLQIFAENLGLAFQIQDDLLDVECETHLTGKPTGNDKTNQKTTYPSLLGVQKSRQHVEKLFSSAIHSLDFLGEKNKLLRDFALLLMQRKK
ncbi:MAG TPA: farnesyl diphosphate synthase [Gammaproteobacteria bacterium]|nr:farnesyl diphosphate synthase [Gammaproteobacteria bacterium]